MKRGGTNIDPTTAEGLLSGAAGTGGGSPAKITLAEMARRFEKIEPKTVSFTEKDDYDKETRRICLGADYKLGFTGLSGWVNIARAPEGQLVVVACETWPEYLAKVGSIVSRWGCEFLVPELEREFGYTHLDAKGRIRIPKELADEAGFKRQVQIFHVGGVLELWDPETHRRRREQAYTTYRDRLFSVAANRRDSGQASPAELHKS